MFDKDQPQPQSETESLADIIREETDDGRLVVRFLIDVMQGKVDDSKPCHRLDAARQLLNLGFEGAHAVIQSASQSASVRAPSRARTNSRLVEGLADIIKLETSDGRDAVRFLVDVMQGNLKDFKPHHRLSAAKELLRRGFDNSPGDSAGDEREPSETSEYENCGHESCKDDPRTPEQRDPSSPNYVGRYAHLSNKEDDPFDFDNYDREQFWRDGWGGRALRHIYGSKEAVTVAHDAVADHRRKTMFDGHIPNRDYTPIENPDDDPYGKGHNGYNAIRFVFGDNAAIRIANKAVEEYKKRKAEHSEGESENKGPPIDRPSTGFPQQNGNSSSDEDDTMPPDHWSRKYMERIRIRSTEADKSSGGPHQSSDPPSSVILERSEEPPAPTPPPRRRPQKIYLGPPDESEDDRK